MSNLSDLLLFYRDAGVDAALNDAPVDHFAEVKEAQQQPTPAAAPVVDTPPVPPTRQPARAAVPDGGQISKARDMARDAKTLDELRALVDAFDGCNLKFTAKSLVFGNGNPAADLMAIGEAPGRDEDLQGLPFVGRSGKLLDLMLAAIGRDRTDTYITNVIPWRPPGNRTPTPQETEICRPFIERHIELVNPKVILALGGPSAKLIAQTTEGIMRLRGNWKTYRTSEGTEMAVMPSLHPAYLLRNPAHKRLAWRDFLAVKMRLKES